MSDALEMHRGRDILDVTTTPSGKYVATNIYNDRRSLRFDSLSHLRRFSVKYSYDVVTYPRHRNT